MSNPMPYSRVPWSAELIDGELVDIGTGEPVIPPDSCECDEGHLCYRVECQEASFIAQDEAEREFGSRPQRLSRDEWRSVYRDDPSKHDSYDRLFGGMEL